MGCPIPFLDTERRLSFAEVRANICSACINADGDICLVTEAKHPGRASISHGVMRPELRCPLPDPMWREQPVKCPGCGRGRQVIRDSRGVCDWCVRKIGCGQSHKVKPGPFTLAGQPTIRVDVVIPESDPKPSPKSTKLIIMVAGGERTQEQFEIAAPFARDYAERCGADFVSLHGDAMPDFPLGNKFRAYPFIAAYERTLFLDCDVIVKASAPSIFDHVPIGQFAAWDELEHVIEDAPIRFVQDESDEFCESQGLGNVTRKSIVNGGLMLFEKQHSEGYKPPSKPLPTRWCADQHSITTWLDRNGHNPFWLDDQWHHSYIAKWFWDRDRLEQAHIIHLHGSRPHDYRMELMRRIADGNYEKIRPDQTANWVPPWAKR